jgi:hypothetical protein
LKKFYLFLFILVACILVGTVIFFKVWNRPKKDIAKVMPDIEVTTLQFAQDFEKNKAESNNKYADKVIQLSGQADEIETDRQHNKHIFFNIHDITIQCTIDKDRRKERIIKKGDAVTLKGRYVGMDTLIGVTVKLYECVLINQ